MKSESINSTNLHLIAGNDELSSYLNSLSRGRQATPHSWLYEREKSAVTLNRWIPLMLKANKMNSPFGDEFNQFDLAQVKKFGPQGKVPPISDPEAQEVIEPLYSPSAFDNPAALQMYYAKAKRFALEVFGTRLMTKRPKSFEHVIDDMQARDTLITNSGFWRFKRRSLVRDQEVQDAISGKAFTYPAIALFRQYNGKLRPVWMFPMSQNLIEFSYSQVIMEALQNSPTSWVRAYLSPWEGYEFVKRTLTTQWHGQHIVGGDTTKMDANMRLAQIRLVFEIVKWLFQPAYWEGLQRCLEHICTIPLIVSTSTQLIGNHGLASGSGWTQLTETILQLFMAWNLGVHGQGIGDDFYWLTDSTAEDLVEYLAAYGLPANPTKQTVGTVSLTFLQRMNHQNFFSREDKNMLGGYYPTIRALNSMLNPEKFHKPKMWNSDMFCKRNFSILENTVDDPCFDEFLRFVAHGHRDMIPFAKKSAEELNNIQAAARRVPGLDPSYNQEKRFKPLSSYLSIQLMKAM